MFFFRKYTFHINYLLKYLRYVFTARWNGYGIHSPFVFNFYQSVLNTTIVEPDHRLLKLVHKRYKNEKDIVRCPSLGAGSVYGEDTLVSVKDFVTRSSVSFSKGTILYNLVRYFKPAAILELGTGVGLSTIYIVRGYPQASVVTVEGCLSKLEYARKQFSEKGLKSITTVHGEFEAELPGILKKMKQVDMVFMDGDHRLHKTLNYFEMLLDYCHNETVLILDDIHWSAEMEKAWKCIQNYSEVRVTIDLFRFGIILFKKELSRQNFIIKY
ncbi:MAG: class I SAM-dependent methyltransferase [Bacteroidales bacterium]